MRIKRLEIIGFKSFADRSVFHFPPGITAIVGPNGCGKSNIVDAIKWVLGEQGVKPLRSKAMGDVIFNGSETRKPTGMAEVTITFTNEDGIAPPRYGEFSEISVRRRLYRSGESEYYINNSPCRLKDIAELFMDTGIGSRSYSIVEQGHIEWLINARPEERRFIFEEAAGIHKYKVRKDEALRKLEATKENLLRVQDIIYEVQRQKRSIQRQARKAERYQAIRKEIREIERSLMAQELNHYTKERDFLTSQLKDLKDRLSSSSTSMSLLEGDEEAKRLELLRKEKGLKVLQEKIHEEEGRVRGVEKTIEVLRVKIENLKKEKVRLEGEGEELDIRRRGLEERKVRIEKEKEELVSELHNLEAGLKAKEKELGGLIERLTPFQRRVEERKRRLMDHLTSLASVKNSVSHSQTEEKRIIQELERRRGERERMDNLLKEKEGELKRIKKELERTEEERQRVEEELKSALKRANVLRSKKEEKEKELHRIKGVLTTVSTRLLALKDSIMSEGPTDLFCSIGEGRVHGLLADVLLAEERFEKALEAVLGERLKGIVVESHEEGVRALRSLKEGGRRGSFIPLKVRERNSNEGSGCYDVGISLADRIMVKEGYEAIARALLKDVVLVEDLEEAVGLWASNGINNPIVTLDGDVIEPSGVLIGGSTKGLDKGALARRRELRELEAEERALRRQKENLICEFERLKEDTDIVAKRIEDLRQLLHRKEIEKVSLEGKERAIKGEIKDGHRKVEILSMEEEGLERELRECRENQEKLVLEQEGLERMIKEEEEAIHRVEEDIKKLLRERETLENLMGDDRVRLASLRAKAEGLFSALNHCNREMEEIEKKVLQRETRLRAIDKELEALSSSLRDREEEMIRKIEGLERLKEDRRELEKGYLRLMDELKVIEDSLRSRRREVRGLEEKISSLSIGLKEIDLKIEHLLARAGEVYGFKEGDLLQVEMERDGEKLKGRLKTLKKDLESIGDVNLGAIEELRELEERERFLITQKEDLERSITSLKAAIQRINRVSRERFLKTMEEVNRTFQGIYTRFFGGGRAQLRMINEEEPLETGIEIVAQPKGKRLQSITLLSGGEKALTVISLIFSLFLVKASPFFLLDEADAPLDETNTARFIALVQELSSRSQFILITHNKKTMEMADTLYGITMAEPGVSKILSVSLVEGDINHSSDRGGGILNAS